MSDKKYKKMPYSIDVIVSVPDETDAEPSFEVRGHSLGCWYELDSDRATSVIEHLKRHQTKFSLDIDGDLPVEYGLQDVRSKTIKGGVTRTTYVYSAEINRSLLSRYSRKDRMRLFKILYPHGTHARADEE